MIPILYLSHCGSNIGGGEKQLYYLVTHLNKNLFQPFVVCPDDGVFAELLRDANISTTILNLPPWRQARYRFTRHKSAAKLSTFCENNKIEIVHTSDSWLNPYLRYVKARLNISVISHVRNLHTSSHVKKYAFNEMDHIISISEQIKIPILNGGIDAQKIDVILNCVDLSIFKPVQPNRERTQRPFVIGLVGRIEPFKRQKSFVEIASHVVSHCDNIRFHIIGASLNSSKHLAYEKEVRQLVSKKKLDSIIQFTGHRDDIHTAMQELDILVTLSAGSVIAEAMATGKPVIGTPIGSTAEMIVDGETGWIIPEDPIVGIVDRIVQLNHDRSLCKKMGVAARKHAESEFSINEHARKVQVIYDRLLRVSK